MPAVKPAAKGGKPPPTPPLKGEKAYLRHPRKRPLATGIAMVECTAGVFLLLPLTQMIASFGKTRPDTTTIEVAIQPPPPPPPDLEPPDPPEPEPPPPEMEERVQPLSLSQMDVALNLGTGDALAGAFAFEGFGVGADDTASDLQIFDVKDLDQAPRMIRQGPFSYPSDLRRSRITGTVLLLVIIDESGAVKVEKVLESRAREFTEVAVRFAEGSTFEPPMKNGRAVRARYTFPVRFAL